MSTPGNVTLVDKDHDETIGPSGPVEGGTLLRLRDDGQGFDDDRLIVPIGPTDFGLEIQCVFSNTVNRRPTWVQVELVRFKLDGTVDPTGKSRRGIFQPGTTTWADTFHVSEYVDADDGAYGWLVKAGRPSDGVSVAPFRVDVQVWDIVNPLAHQIHRLGGWNVMSDGTVSDKAWK